MKLFKNILMTLMVITTLFTVAVVTIPLCSTPPHTCKWCGEDLVSIKDINETTALVSIKDINEDLVSIEDVNKDLISIADIHANLVPIQNVR